MTNEELKEIEARAEAAYKSGLSCRSINMDIPALVAEVRRLRSLVNEAANILYEAPEFNTTDSRVEDLLLAIREAYFILTSQGDRA